MIVQNKVYAQSYCLWKTAEIIEGKLASCSYETKKGKNVMQ